MNLLGLVLAGGQSTRMGRDKSLFTYHNSSQREHCLNLLEDCGIKGHLSLNKEQIEGPNLNPRVIYDCFENIGPAGGILSAHLKYPQSAFLVIACDMPFVEKKHINLLKQSYENKVTLFKSKRLEPLLAIWTSKSLNQLKTNVAQGEFSLKYTLNQVEKHYLNHSFANHFLRNINSVFI